MKPPELLLIPVVLATQIMALVQVVDRQQTSALKQGNVTTLVHASVVEPSMPTVVHDKEKGNGYKPGSPLYNKQQVSPDDEAKDIPVSTTMKCISNLLLQYFAIYTALMVVKGISLFQGRASSPSPVERLLQAATMTVNLAPMLCVLFLGTRMRAIQLSGGNTEKYKLPQWWVQMAMQICSWSVLGQLIMVLVTPVVTNTMPRGGDEPVPAPNKTLRIVLEAIRYTLLLGLYVGFILVVVGIHMMPVPREVYPTGTVPVSPAVQCTISLTTIYFMVYFCLEMFRSYNELQGFQTSKGYETFKLATFTVAFCPMLCVLFIGARMRALQMGLDGPQLWAQWCFYACTASVWTVTFLVILVPFLFGIRPKEGSCEGDITFETPPSEKMLNVAKLLAVVRWIAMVCLYVGFTAVMVSTLVIEHPQGAEHTPDLSPAMLCVTLFTIQYFTVYLLIWVMVTIKQFTSNEFSGNKNVALEALVAAKDSVAFAPMLSVLFLGARMRALQITNNKGAPQGWAQDCMFLCLVSVLLQAILAIVIEFMAPREGPGAKSQSAKAAAGVAAFQFFLALTMHGGALAVIISIFLITPQTANGRGSMLMDKVANTETGFLFF